MIVSPQIENPAKARLTVDMVAGCSAATAACASNPMKLLIPRSRGSSVWACVGTYGGGFVAGDETSLDVQINRGARCFLTTQASTKIYRNPRHRPCSHSLRADIAEDALLVLAPDTVQSFAGSVYTQRQEFHLAASSNLALLDWYGSGRAARQERWSFHRLQSRNEIFVDGKTLLVDSLLLDQAHGPLESPSRMGRFNSIALLVLTGPTVAKAAGAILDEIDALPVTKRAPMILSASPISQGAIIRVAGESGEDVGRTIRRFLKFASELLGDDPWARKW